MEKGCQSVLDCHEKKVFEGEWNPSALYETLTCGDHEFWRGKRVLDIGANTCGLSVEIARRGSNVVALEPDPYKNTYAKSKDIVNSIVTAEGLNLKVYPKGLFNAHEFKGFDVVLCLGLLYHFRYPQLILDYLSTLEMEYLFLGTQVHSGESLALFNRRDPSIRFAPDFFKPSIILTGWHPTRPLLERMLQWAGFAEVLSLTAVPYSFPNKQPGLTNSAYYRCRRIGVVDPQIAMTEFYPR